MDLSGIISISGKPGLFKVVAQSKNTIIVESLIDNKRVPAYSSDRISALQDISIYTYEEDIPLEDVLTSLAKKQDCKSCISHKESAKKLANELSVILPEYDEGRVYSSDIKKIFQWYNILQKADLITLEEKKEKEEDKSEKKKKEPAKKTTSTAKKPAAKKSAPKKASPKKAAPKRAANKAPTKKGGS